jgi:malate dehydrogenase (oxaloacetate-decarboxylating)(NADP+)
MLQSYIKEGLTPEQAKQNIWFVDIDGLLVNSRKNILPHNQMYAQDYKEMNFLDAVNDLKPNVLIGASGAGGAFTKDIIEAMARHNEQPIIFALSNPTANSECTAQQAIEWSEGRAIFASGSPFGSVEYNGRTYLPGQGNNVYIFPGLGLGAIAAEARYLPDSIFITASQILASQVSQEDLDKGGVYPGMSELREISFKIALGVAEEIFNLGLSNRERPKDLEFHIKQMIFNSKY